MEAASISLKVDSDRVTLAYSNLPLNGEWTAMNYPVRLSRMACHYGGERVWWLCPMEGCGRRVAVLYGGAMFACRHCQQRAYQSQRESPMDRLARRANKLRARLGWRFSSPAYHSVSSPLNLWMAVHYLRVGIARANQDQQENRETRKRAPRPTINADSGEQMDELESPCSVMP